MVPSLNCGGGYFVVGLLMLFYLNFLKKCFYGVVVGVWCTSGFRGVFGSGGVNSILGEMKGGVLSTYDLGPKACLDRIPRVVEDGYMVLELSECSD